MKCIDCDKEAEYLYIYGFPASGISFIPVGGSYCSECLHKVKEKQKEMMRDWIEFHKKLDKK